MNTRISWLHISDFHFSNSQQSWSEQVVARDLLNDIRQRTQNNEIHPRFVVMSGDSTFSGQRTEYDLAATFFDELLATIGLSKCRFFCVAGNHDVVRNRSFYTYKGIDRALMGPSDVDELFRKPHEVAILLRRQSSYRFFCARYLGIDRYELTDDGLGYVSTFSESGIPFVVAGLNSGWLAHGGDVDRNRVLVGDTQIINVENRIRTVERAINIGIVHHPLDWLRDYDRITFTRRLVPLLDVLHSGHVHSADSFSVKREGQRQCAFISAGAGFAGRMNSNSYSIATVDFSTDSIEVDVYSYEHTSGAFEKSSEHINPLSPPPPRPNDRNQTIEALSQLERTYPVHSV